MKNGRVQYLVAKTNELWGSSNWLREHVNAVAAQSFPSLLEAKDSPEKGSPEEIEANLKLANAAYSTALYLVVNYWQQVNDKPLRAVPATVDELIFDDEAMAMYTNFHAQVAHRTMNNERLSENQQVVALAVLAVSMLALRTVPLREQQGIVSTVISEVLDV